jgi:DNA repair ATPase RecN
MHAKMRQILIIAAAFFTLNVFAQIKNIKVPLVKNVNPQTISQNDTILKVLYVNKNVSEKRPAYYLNGQFVNETLLKTLNPNVIENIRVEHQEIEVETEKYYGQIFINTKDNYKPKLISLNDLKSKYTDLKNASSVFMIDHEIINDDYDKCIVDENYILKISVERIENNKERLKFNLIRILTKTKENIRKSKEIRIRGVEKSNYI